jgi:thymidylate synthase
MANQEEQNYLDLLKEILENGVERQDRTGVGTKSIFGTRLKFSLADGKIPMITSKKMFARGVIEELLFFLRGETDTKKLEAKNVNIWKGNTSREYLDKHDLEWLPEGHMGKGYGFQWRHFGGDLDVDDPYKTPIDREGYDQVKRVIHLLKTDPNNRRIIISAWNPPDLHHMALPPCHMMVQFYANNNELSSQFYMRSVDNFLGSSFNFMSYGTLTHIIAKTVGMKAKELIFVGGDSHIYNSHIKQVKEQLTREPFPFPTLSINKELKTIEDIEKLEWEDFKIEGYKSHPVIKAEMAI